jgi:gamma-glutamyl:cysteine ligase YbdK (ATP-grasp superfamily)
MKKIVVVYWKEHDLIPYFEHNSEFEYSVEKQSEIVQIIIERGLSVMVRPNMGHDKNTLLVYIDKGRFGQS